jgi:hypothetical protein
LSGRFGRLAVLLLKQGPHGSGQEGHIEQAGRQDVAAAEERWVIGHQRGKRRSSEPVPGSK